MSFKTVVSSVFCLLFCAVLLGACTQNQRARSMGGTATKTLPPNTKLVTATWKADSLWVLYRDRREGEPVETYRFEEDSSFGVIQGAFIIQEQ